MISLSTEGTPLHYLVLKCFILNMTDCRCFEIVGTYDTHVESGDMMCLNACDKCYYAYLESLYEGGKTIILQFRDDPQLYTVAQMHRDCR